MHNHPNRTTSSSNSPEPNNGHLNNHVQVVSPEPTSYKDGYIHGRVTERHIDNQRREILAENTAARALLLGISLTSLLGLAIGAIFLLNHRNQQQEVTPEVTPVVVPSPKVTQTPTSQTTIIERTQIVPTNPAPATTSNSAQQQLVPTQRNTTSPSRPAPQPQSSTIPRNPSTVQQNSAPQPSPLPSQNPTGDRTTTPIQPHITNQASPGQNQTSNPTNTSPRTTQPYTTNQALPSQTQNSTPTGTTTTTPSSTTNQTSPDTTQNQTQPDNSSVP